MTIRAARCGKGGFVAFRSKRTSICSSAFPQREGTPLLTAGPVRHAAGWLAYVNEPQTEAAVEALRACIRRRRPNVERTWMERTARRMGLEASLRPRGRPRKEEE